VSFASNAATVSGGSGRRKNSDFRKSVSSPCCSPSSAPSAALLGGHVLAKLRCRVRTGAGDEIVEQLRRIVFAA
jgi:hypothetical protein